MNHWGRLKYTQMVSSFNQGICYYYAQRLVCLGLGRDTKLVDAMDVVKVTWLVGLVEEGGQS